MQVRLLKGEIAGRKSDLGKRERALAVREEAFATLRLAQGPALQQPKCAVLQETCAALQLEHQARQAHSERDMARLWDRLRVTDCPCPTTAGPGGAGGAPEAQNRHDGPAAAGEEGPSDA